MTTVQNQIATRIAYKEESTYGDLPGASGGKVLRRVSSALGLKKAAIESKEKRGDYQHVDVRHGQRSVDGAINCELVPGAYADFLAAALRRDFSTVTSIANVNVTADDATKTFTRDSGSWLDDGLRVGLLVSPSGFATGTTNDGKLFTIVALTATVMTVAETVVDGAGTATTWAVPGKVSYVPETGHTKKSFTIEQMYDDAAVSHRFTGCRVSQVALQVNPNAEATVNFTMLGKDRQKDSTAYFSNPTPASDAGFLAGSSGVLVVNGAPVGVCTAWSMTIDGGMAAGGVVGANTTPDIFVGAVKVTGQVSVYFNNGAMDDYFDHETPVSLVLRLDGSDGTVTFVTPKVKLSGGSMSGDREIIQQFDFQALKNEDGTGLNKTTLLIQDTSL